MNDEFENINSRIPDLGTALVQRIAAKTGTTTTPPPGTFDPYELLVKKKNATDTGEIDQSTVVKWPEEDLKKLQDYCAKIGVVGFNCGRMHPLAAMALLKKQFGEDYTGVPLEERCPPGYEKIGTRSPYSSNFPYTEAMKKKQILHG